MQEGCIIDVKVYGVMLMRSMTPDEARQFAEKWLSAWTGNQPQTLAAFYTGDLFYSNPALPDGVSGKRRVHPLPVEAPRQQPRLDMDA
jgi:hypothetical protein